MDGGLNKIELDRVYRGVRHRLLGEARTTLEIGGRVVRRRLGTGAAGLVYAALDRDLERDVAIKIVVCTDDAARQRVREEARRLAELDHPNIVRVFDVGVHAGDPYIVMELIDGQTLDRWAAAHRDLPQRLVVFAALAEGLAAVHTAGLVHRDVKPTNVLVGEDGRPRLIDFGLAHAHGARSPGPSGTPGYRAPEVAAGRSPTFASDQFGLFASLAEVLADGPLPRRVRALIRRGCAASPDRRFADMSAVARALTHASRRRWRRALAVAGIAGAVAATLWATTPSRCDEVEPLPGPPPELRAGLVSAAGELGAQIADRLHATSARYQTMWGVAYGETCRATWERGEQSHALLDQRMRCLAAARHEFAAILDALDAGDTETLTRGVSALASLPPPLRCAALRESSTSADPALSRALAEAKAQRRLGKYEAARPRLVALSERAPDPSAELAEALLDLAAIDAQRLAADKTVATLERAVAVAHAVGRVDLEASGWLQLLHVTLTRARRSDRARAMLPDVRATVELGGGDRDRVRLRSMTALLERDEGDLVGATEAMTLAVADAEALSPSDPALVATVVNNLAGLVAAAGDVDQARSLHERALRVRIEALGPAHPDVAMSEMNLGLVSMQAGDPRGAVSHFDAVLAVAMQIVGPDDVGLCRVYLPRARARALLDDRPGARADAEQALRLALAGEFDGVAEQARAMLADASAAYRSVE
ncbi:MAG: serine/threonine-protein kinase [Myxococcota bacterium]